MHPTKDDLFQPGDLILGKYKVHSRLGKGGFGLVYLIYDRETHRVYAIKTFRDELLANAAARQAFKREALLWLNLGEHPFILPARWVEEISGRLFVATDYIAPDDQGWVNLADHLNRAGGTLETNRVLEWAIQFCHGMAHANAHGIQAHRDIKPSNILITQDGRVQIADFGLATAVADAGHDIHKALVTGDEEFGYSLSLLRSEGKTVCGTPGYIPPEIFEGQGADVRSDLYAFGLVLWEMATGSSRPPFQPTHPCRDVWDYQEQVYEQQKSGCSLAVDSPLHEVITGCLQFQPVHRYADFTALRSALVPLYLQLTGRTVNIPETGEKTAVFWSNKGSSLYNLGRHEEALRCCDQALTIDPRHEAAWNNKGRSLCALGRHEEALRCYEQALAIDPRYVTAWNNKGACLLTLVHNEDAVRCFDQCLAINPQYLAAWYNKGVCLHSQRRDQEALNCYEQALAIDLRFVYAWLNKGASMEVLGRREEALRCYDRALTIDPQLKAALYNKAHISDALGYRRDAREAYTMFLQQLPSPEDVERVVFARKRLRELERSTPNGGY